jgi:hypothetical protein
MKNIETAPTAAPVETVAAVKVPTQFTVNTSKDDKGFIADLTEEFELKNTMEAVALLRAVAEKGRFYTETVPVMETPEGETEAVQTLDTDGQPVFETLTRDKWENAANEIHANREGLKAQAQLDKLRAKMAELEASQAKYKNKFGLN